MEAIMPDRSPSSQTHEGQHDNPMPIGIPLAAAIAVLFLFGSTFFNSGQKSFDVAAERLSSELPTHH
jgi:hypothetical protein